MSDTTEIAELPKGPYPEEVNCYFCGGPLENDSCIHYHWNDSIHLRNKAEGKRSAPELHTITHTEGSPCWTCGAATDAEGRCTRINEFFHTPFRDAAVRFFHTKDEAMNAPPVTFLIEGFLQREGVTAIAAPVRERKSLIALNMAHALVTGEKLFDHFEVTKRPSHVLYLCPEVSLGPFTDRVRKIGLLDYVGENFFYRTLSADGHLRLDDKDLQAMLPGSVVFLDTAIRFIDGDENSSKDVRAFADGIFALLRNGAESVVLLHHSPKDSGDFMTLENAMRGSGDLGAFLACAYGTKLQDPKRPYESTSFMSNLKQRDFQSEDFELTCTPDCRMHYVEAGLHVSLVPRKTRANKDGLEDAAMQLLQDNPALSVRDIVAKFKEAGIRRGKSWVHEKRYEMLQTNGGKLSGETSSK